MNSSKSRAPDLFSSAIRGLTLSLLFIFILATCSVGSANEVWKWIYKDDTCIVYADFTTLHIWDKPEGDCVDIYTMTNLSNLGREELLTGREISNKTLSGWQTVSTIITRQLFMLKERKVQMLTVTYYDDSGKILEEEKQAYSPDRWTTLRQVERSQKVYDIIVDIAKNTK
ncbi:MAG: hypothetical protein WCV63_01985 [Negativicutes bacterium]